MHQTASRVLALTPGHVAIRACPRKGRGPDTQLLVQRKICVLGASGIKIRPIEEVAVVSDNDVGAQLLDVCEELAKHGFFVGLVHHHERTGILG